MAKKKDKKPKSRKSRRPKGKSLSQKLAEKDAIKQAEIEAEQAAAAAAAAAEEEDDALDSEPPPAPDFDDDDEDDYDDEDFEDDEPAPDADAEDIDTPQPVARETVVRETSDDDEEAPPSSELGEDEEWVEEDDDDEEGAAAQMGHQRYVIAGFFGLWLIVGFLCGAALEMAWSNFAAKDWFVEAVPSLAAIPHEGDLISRASISLVVGGFLGGLIVLRYYTRPDIRQWADEVAEQLAYVKWPNRKEVGNNTVVVMIATAIITGYLTLLDRFWDFITTMIYTSGT